MLQIKLKKLLYFILISLIMLTLMRFALWLLYTNDFSTLNYLETLKSFGMGVRIDLISITTPSAIFILILFLPFKFTNNQKFQKIIVYIWYTILLLITFIILADLVYFQFVHRHVGSEITAVGNDIGLLIDILFEYKFLLIFFIFLATILFFIFKKIANISTENRTYTYLSNIAIFLLITALLVGSIRGRVQGKPFSISDAFVVNKTASGNLALNGFYTLYRTFSKSKKRVNYHFYDDKEALKITQELLTSKPFEFTSKEYPLERKLHRKTKEKKYNIVIILLESWSSKYVDSFGKNNLKVTPNLDNLAKNGLMFTNFYANGQRSIEGITALLTGIPVLKNFNFLGSGLELSNLSYLGTLAKENNYSTIAMQSSKRGSFRVDSISKMAGFDSYFGAEDMPSVGDEDKNSKPRFGTWDGNMYDLLYKKLSTQKEPFLSFAFTSTTHTPFYSPGKKWEVYPHNNKNLFGYLNTLKYADDKLGLFMKKAKKEPWFDNTIFIFMADHTIGFGDDSSMFEGTNISIKNRELEEMRIPLVIYAPKIFKPKVIKTIGSQADILPTLVDILNWKGHFTTLSNSILTPSSKPFALFNSGQTISMVNKSGYIKHTLKKRLELTGDSTMEKELLSIYQTGSKLLQNNKWYHNDK